MCVNQTRRSTQRLEGAGRVQQWDQRRHGRLPAPLFSSGRGTQGRPLFDQTRQPIETAQVTCLSQCEVTRGDRLIPVL